MISLYDILDVSNGQLFGEPSAQIFLAFSIDPARVTPNSLYVTLKTDWQDTHRYIEEAIASGASGVLCVRPPECDTTGISVILVQDTVTALMAWSQHILGKTGVNVICVTGSTGKSVTIEALQRVLSTRYKVHHIPHHTPDNRLSIPITLAQLTPEHQYVVLRMGTTQPGEIAAMLQASQPKAGVLLTIDHTHSNRFENIEHVAQEHRKLLEYLSPGSLAVLNYDDDRVRAMSGQSRAKVMTIGVESFGANMMAFNVIAGPNGTGFDLRYGSERYIGRWIPLLGKHQLYSVLAALSVGLHYGISLEEGLKAITHIQPLPGRMNPLTGLHDAILIDDTHSATPQSTLAALEWLANARDANQRVIFVFGGMSHLGAHSQLAHRTVGQQAADAVDILICDGTEAATSARAALDKGMSPAQLQISYSTHDTVQALKTRFTLTPNDLVLVKGSETMQMERIVRALLKESHDATNLVRQTHSDNTTEFFQPSRPSWIEVDTEAIAGNVQAIKRLIGEQVGLMAVVKADAYGHGAVAVSQIALLNGAEYLAVANLEEALELRDGGIDAPILILSYTPVYAVREAIRQRLTVTLYDLQMARAYDRAAREIGGKLRVHVKVDTGMGRLGVMPEDVMLLFRHLATLQYIEVEGIYTHFSAADEDPIYTAEQVATFKHILRPLRAAGIDFKYIHAANSAGIFASKDNHFTMVRSGIAMYGLSPAERSPLPEVFKPALRWKSVVAQVKQLPPGHVVGYGNTYRTTRRETVAIIPIGYADGFRRSPTWGEVLIHGQRAPIIGRVSMEKTIVNISHIPDVSIGDEVVLLGQQGGETITADEIAARLGTINYEVVCNVLPRVPRR
jgi:Alr-MurF fusion protein